MTAIQKPMLKVLKAILKERYVPYLPPLLGDAPSVNRPDKQISRAFSAFVLQALFEVDPKRASEAVVDDYNDNGVDAIYYHEPENTLYFVQSKLKLTEQFQLGEAQSFLSGVKQLINKQFETFNQNVKNLEQTIEDALDKCDQIKLIVAYTGDGISTQANNEIRRVLQIELDDGDEQLQQKIIEFGADKVEEALRKEQAVKLVNTKLNIHQYKLVKGHKKTVFGTVSIQDLVKLHDKHGKSLYEKNIRYFIGSGKRGVNTAIKNTLLNEPENFFFLNNGITLICHSFKQRSKSKNNNTTRMFEILGMSVVNGAQTIASAAEFTQEHPDSNISKAKVMLTLIHTGTENEFHKQVTKARNLQNPVDIANFVALDDKQERLRQEIALNGLEYHYRPQQKLRVGISVITIETLVKALACLNQDIRYPALLKSEFKQFLDINSDVYKELITDKVSGCVAINAITVFSAIQTLLKAAERSSPSPEKLLYRHSGYALSSVLMKRLKNRIHGADILPEEKIREILSVPFDELRQTFADQYRIYGLGSAPHAFFKQISNTSNLIQQVTIHHQNMADDNTVKKLQGRVNREDSYNQALTNYLIGKAEPI